MHHSGLSPLSREESVRASLLTAVVDLLAEETNLTSGKVINVLGRIPLGNQAENFLKQFNITGDSGALAKKLTDLLYLLHSESGKVPEIGNIK